MNFDISELVSEDTATMTVHSNGTPTNWVWVFAGPGHPKTVAQSNKISKQRLNTAKAIEQARANNKKWKAEEETPQEVLDRNVETIAVRLLDWYLVEETKDAAGNVELIKSSSVVTFNGSSFPCTLENSKKILSNPSMDSLLNQTMEFLADDSSFMKSFANSSENSQEKNSNSQSQKTGSQSESN